MFRIGIILSWVCGKTISFVDPVMNGFAVIQHLSEKCLKLTLLNKRKQVTCYSHHTQATKDISRRKAELCHAHIRPKEPWVWVGGFTAHWRFVVRSQVWQPASFS